MGREDSVFIMVNHCLQQLVLLGVGCFESPVSMYQPVHLFRGRSHWPGMSFE